MMKRKTNWTNKKILMRFDKRNQEDLNGKENKELKFC
jgi:hypothetical protein